MKDVPFQISSRATILLGRESVARASGAVIELVKNTYDADAEFCIVYFDIAEDIFYILDNGTGMTEELVLSNWMLIGTDNKKIDYVSVKERIKSGEKGIGRFALDRLGMKCEMYTKNKSSQNMVHWKANWSDFEKPGVNVNDIKAQYELVNNSISSILPECILETVKDIKAEKNIDLNLEQGTLFIINNLRDTWTKKSIEDLINDMAFLIPPQEQEDFKIAINSDITDKVNFIESTIAEEYDHKISVTFEDNIFKIKSYRNEYDVKRIPEDIFNNPKYFQAPRYTRDSLNNKEVSYNLSIEELFKIPESDRKNQNEKIDNIKNLGEFTFDYIFLKRGSSKNDKKRFHYKEIGNKRQQWLENYGGIKIYRDNFWIRPYGDPSSESFDWLGLDKRVGANPAGVASDTLNWHVGNGQGQGTLFISRVHNDKIADVASREGLVNNDTFLILKETLINVISILEKDRAIIANTFKRYDNDTNKESAAKSEGQKIAKEILKSSKHSTKNNYSDNKQADENSKKMAEAIRVFETEQEELMSELQLLKSLATNGLITTSIVHDLRNIRATFQTRSNDFFDCLKFKDFELLGEHLVALKKNDEYLNTWMQIVMEQAKSDKRKRTKEDIGEVLKRIVSSIEPILKQKKITIRFNDVDGIIYKRIFYRDFESIMYNLIINSIDAFERQRNKETSDQINITLVPSEKSFIIEYSDNGPGLDKSIKMPTDILKYGETTKRNIDGEINGMGLGMYIVNTTLREYNAQIEFPSSKIGEGFKFNMVFPNNFSK